MQMKVYSQLTLLLATKCFSE